MKMPTNLGVTPYTNPTSALDGGQDWFELCGRGAYGRGGYGWPVCRSLRWDVSSAGEPVDEVVWRPGSGKLQDTFLHHGAGGREFVLVALDTFAIDQMRDIQQHLAAFGHPAAYFFV